MPYPEMDVFYVPRFMSLVAREFLRALCFAEQRIILPSRSRKCWASDAAVLQGPSLSQGSPSPGQGSHNNLGSRLLLHQPTSKIEALQ